MAFDGGDISVVAEKRKLGSGRRGASLSKTAAGAADACDDFSTQHPVHQNRDDPRTSTIIPHARQDEGE